MSLAPTLSVLIGGNSFASSPVAFAKLPELISGRPLTVLAHQAVNGALALALLAASGYFLAIHAGGPVLVALLVGALALGVLVVLPVGGADMPVMISLLNSLTGLAAAANGFVLGINALVIGGALVGASGTI